jgi:Predicted signal transduction protein with a C-terminal ATPase domain
MEAICLLKNVSYLTKSLVAYSTIIILFMAAYIAFYYNSQVSGLKQTTQNSMTQLTEKASEQFGSLLDDMSRISLGVAGSSEVWSAMSDAVNAAPKDTEANYFNYHPQQKNAINDVITDVNGDNFNNRSINIISHNDDYLSLDIYDDETLSKSQIARVPAVSYLLKHDISKYISPVAKDAYGHTDNETFSFMRLIQSNFEVYGAVDVAFERTYLDKIFGMKISGYAVHTVIVKDDGTLFYASADASRQMISDILRQGRAPSEKQIVKTRKLDGITYAQYSVAVPAYGMNIYMLVNREYYLLPVEKTTTVMIIWTLIIMVAAFIIIFAVTRNLYRPIRQLRDSIGRIDYSNLSIDLQVEDTNNEVTLLAETFNKMFAGIKKTTGELMQSRTREIKANYNVLQAQINPHFIYNILTVIGLMGQQKNVPEIMDICSSLSKMLSYSTSSAQQTVTVKNEIEHVENYLKLMKYRYLDQLQYEITVDDPLSEIEIPKFVLQPIAENCFKHSFRNVEPPYHVTISGQSTQTGWRIIVEDNGDGFTGESLSWICRQFEKVKNDIENGTFSSDLKIGGLALVNTYARLLLYSNGKIRFAVSNNASGGSRVIISHEEDVG